HALDQTREGCSIRRLVCACDDPRVARLLDAHGLVALLQLECRDLGVVEGKDLRLLIGGGGGRRVGVGSGRWPDVELVESNDGHGQSSGPGNKADGDAEIHLGLGVLPPPSRRGLGEGVYRRVHQTAAPAARTASGRKRKLEYAIRFICEPVRTSVRGVLSGTR